MMKLVWTPECTEHVPLLEDLPLIERTILLIGASP